MFLLGYLASILIGISLGLIGGGGAILTIPVLVFLLQVSPTLATTYSLFVVGVCSFVGSMRVRKDIDFNTTFLFGSASIISVLLTRKLLFPLIPKVIFSVNTISIERDNLLMVLFGLIMLAAANSMIRKSVAQDNSAKKKIGYLLLLGLGVGIVTGILGAGGGFLIIPALVLFNKMVMKNAVATSLSIITINSLIGFLGSFQNAIIDWKLLVPFTTIAVAGIFIGTSLSKKIDNRSLKKGFGWFLMMMGIFILLREFFLLM